ncbi:MAG: hypothetical protein ACRDS9_15650, partial [Pseudonocardiaceae bacterium]
MTTTEHPPNGPDSAAELAPEEVAEQVRALPHHRGRRGASARSRRLYPPVADAHHRPGHRRGPHRPARVRVPAGIAVPALCGETQTAPRRSMPEGWHLDEEPVLPKREPTGAEKDLMGCRADLVGAYSECKAAGDEDSCEQIRESVRVLDEEIRTAGIKGRLTPLDPRPKGKRRSIWRRQNLPDLPCKPVDGCTLGRVFAGKYRPSLFVT